MIMILMICLTIGSSPAQAKSLFEAYHSEPVISSVAMDQMQERSSKIMDNTQAKAAAFES